MDKLIYFLAGLAIGNILSRRAEKAEECAAFLPMSPEMLQQIQQQIAGPPMPEMQHPVETPQEQRECTFTCWLCSGTTTFYYHASPGPVQFQVDCHRCGMQNVIKLD